MTSVRELECEFRRLVGCGALSLPDPASGRTVERHARLLEVGRTDVQMARVAEAHTDAISILHEAGRSEIENGLYGVWAAEDPTCKVGASQTCTDSCNLSDSICKNADRICVLAKELGGSDAYANETCDRGNASCKASRERCCGCM